MPFHGLALNILLALIFSAFQAYEQHSAPNSMDDGIYGSTFTMATGFHGFHVIIGTIFLAACWLRLIEFHFSIHQLLGQEAAAIYFHFVGAQTDDGYSSWRTSQGCSLPVILLKMGEHMLHLKWVSLVP
eukprot:EC097145.1.p1 GENE.EC097145.1~~EC097145.1.p1  ORF type:complete len:129 (-),score=6.70 EC097145.1:191-577(-)